MNQKPLNNFSTRVILSTVTVLVFLLSLFGCEKPSSSDITPWDWMHESIWPALCFLTNDWEYQTSFYQAGETLWVGTLGDQEYLQLPHIRLLFTSTSGDSEEVGFEYIPAPITFGGFSGLCGASIPSHAAQEAVPWNNLIEIVAEIELITAKVDSVTYAWVSK